MIDSHPDFELITQPTLSLLTYRVVPSQLHEHLARQNTARSEINRLLNELAVSVQKRQREAGKSFVSRTRLTTEQYPDSPVTVFRVVLANPLTTDEDLSNILTEQATIAQDCSQWQALCDLVAPESKVG